MLLVEDAVLIVYPLLPPAFSFDRLTCPRIRYDLRVLSLISFESLLYDIDVLPWMWSYRLDQ